MTEGCSDPKLKDRLRRTPTWTLVQKKVCSGTHPCLHLSSLKVDLMKMVLGSEVNEENQVPSPDAIQPVFLVRLNKSLLIVD